MNPRLLVLCFGNFIGAYVSETVGWPAGFLIGGSGALLAAAAVHLTIPRGLMSLR